MSKQEVLFKKLIHLTLRLQGTAMVLGMEHDGVAVVKRKIEDLLSSMKVDEALTPNQRLEIERLNVSLRTFAKRNGLESL
jgi:hypothetical protein